MSTRTTHRVEGQDAIDLLQVTLQGQSMLVFAALWLQARVLG